MSSVRVPLRKRGGEVAAYALIDAEDLPEVQGFNWFLCKGYAARNVYVRPGKCHTLAMHRHLLGLGHGDKREAHHKNRDRLDNRRSNLEVTTRAEHAKHHLLAGHSCQGNGVGGGISTKGKGYTKNGNRWLAQPSVLGRKRYLGQFGTEDEARAVVAIFRGIAAMLLETTKTPRRVPLR